jgi:hypothetical protein
MNLFDQLKQIHPPARFRHGHFVATLESFDRQKGYADFSLVHPLIEEGTEARVRIRWAPQHETLNGFRLVNRREVRASEINPFFAELDAMQRAVLKHMGAVETPKQPPGIVAAVRVAGRAVDALVGFLNYYLRNWPLGSTVRQEELIREAQEAIQEAVDEGIVDPTGPE